MPNNILTEEFINSEKQRIAGEIAVLEIYLTADEKGELAEQLKIHPETMRRYAKGDVGSIGMGAKMLAELKKLTADRVPA